MALAAHAALVCCGGTVTFVWELYQGPSRPRDSIAIIRSDGASPTELIAIDGESIRAPLEHDNRLHVEVLPGIHEVDVAAPSIGLRHVVSVRLLALAGRVYRVEVSPAPGGQAQPDNGEPPLRGEGWDVHAYEVDRETDARLGIADAPAAQAPPPRPARPRSWHDASDLRDGGDDAGGERAYDASPPGEG
jgi:hypothetical protein